MGDCFLMGNGNGTEVYYLGQGTSFDVKSKLPYDYDKLTINNFIIQPNNIYYNTGRKSAYPEGRNPHAYIDGGTFSLSGSVTLNKSYNSSNGILTCYSSVAADGEGSMHTYDRDGTTTNYVRGSTSGNYACSAWVVIGDIENL